MDWQIKSLGCTRQWYVVFHIPMSTQEKQRYDWSKQRIGLFLSHVHLRSLNGLSNAAGMDLDSFVGLISRHLLFPDFAEITFFVSYLELPVSRFVFHLVRWFSGTRFICTDEIDNFERICIGSPKGEHVVSMNLRFYPHNLSEIRALLRNCIQVCSPVLFPFYRRTVRQLPMCSDAASIVVSFLHVKVWEEFLHPNNECKPI